MGSLHRNIQLMMEFLKAPCLVLQFSYYTLMNFLMLLSVILLSILMILLYSKCDEASDLLQQLELASERESDLRETVDWGKKCLVDSSAGKTELVLCDWSITLVEVLQNWLNWFNFLFLEGGLLVILTDCMIFQSPFLDVIRMSISTVSFLAQLDFGILCL